MQKSSGSSDLGGKYVYFYKQATNHFSSKFATFLLENADVSGKFSPQEVRKCPISFRKYE